MRQVERSGLLAPAKVLDLAAADLTAAPDRSIDVAGFRSMFCLLREAERPVALTFWVLDGDRSVRVGDLAVQRSPLDLSLPIEPVRDNLTVVICTRNRAESLRRTLESLSRQTDPNFEALIVDNAPTDQSTREVAEADWPFPCRYLLEGTPGLSHARNAGLANVRTELVAWIDDDEVADPGWMAAIRRGFAHPSAPAAVNGLMLPAELETEAQVRFEQYGGFNKGRDIHPLVLTDGTTVRSPLYPLPGFGAGGNMAFRTATLRSVGPFDPHLGAGTQTHGGEETQVLALLLLQGENVLHWPSAITWHYHRRSMAELRKQVYGYAAGLTAFFVSMVRRKPRLLVGVIRLVPQGLADIRANQKGDRLGELPADFPRDLVAASRRGLLAGGAAYLLEVAGQWRARRAR